MSKFNHLRALTTVLPGKRQSPRSASMPASGPPEPLAPLGRNLTIGDFSRPEGFGLSVNRMFIYGR